MRRTTFISPTIKTFETDKSDKTSVYSKASSPSGGAPSGEPSGEGGTGIPSTTFFILLENDFYMLQEDNNKIII